MLSFPKNLETKSNSVGRERWRASRLKKNISTSLGQSQSFRLNKVEVHPHRPTQLPHHVSAEHHFVPPIPLFLLVKGGTTWSTTRSIQTLWGHIGTLPRKYWRWPRLQIISVSRRFPNDSRKFWVSDTQVLEMTFWDLYVKCKNYYQTTLQWLKQTISCRDPHPSNCPRGPAFSAPCAAWPLPSVHSGIASPPQRGNTLLRGLGRQKRVDISRSNIGRKWAWASNVC